MTAVVAGEHGLGLESATVTATTSSGTLTGTTGTDGRYVFTAQGSVALRVEMTGYNGQEKTVTVSSNMTVPFWLSRTVAADAYHLTVTASPSCSLPSDATPRQYTATLAETASGLAVYLSGPTLIAFGGEAGFAGTRDGNTVRFEISGNEWAPYSFIEFLPGTRWLVYAGTATGTISGNTIVATFNGTVRVVAYPAEATVAECQAADHRMEFVR